jgi:hypothetical protein
VQQPSWQSGNVYMMKKLKKTEKKHAKYVFAADLFKVALKEEVLAAIPQLVLKKEVILREALKKRYGEGKWKGSDFILNACYDDEKGVTPFEDVVTEMLESGYSLAVIDEIGLDYEHADMLRLQLVQDADKDEEPNERLA